MHSGDCTQAGGNTGCQGAWRLVGGEVGREEGAWPYVVLLVPRSGCKKLGPRLIMASQVPIDAVLLLCARRAQKVCSEVKCENLVIKLYALVKCEFVVAGLRSAFVVKMRMGLGRTAHLKCGGGWKEEVPRKKWRRPDEAGRRHGGMEREGY